MRNRYSFVLLLALAVCPMLGFFPQASGQTTIGVTSIVAPVSQLTIGDIDFRHSTTPKWLFTININVTGVSSLWVKMTVNAEFVLSGNESYRDALVFTTDSFEVVGSRSISNLDLDRTIRLTSYIVKPAAKHALEETALSTGQIPAGTYTFDVVVTADGSPPILPGRTGFEIVLTNPTTVELISPSDGDQFVNQFPTFQWQYDGPSSRISIFEKLPGQASLEEAASGIPHYLTVTTTNSLRYPTSGARNLEPGKTYAWFVEGLAGAAGGTTVSRKSALRSFTVASNGTESLSSLLDELARALPQYQALFDELKAQGFTAGGTTRLNGAAISISELQKLLNNLRLHPDAVTLVDSE